MTKKTQNDKKMIQKKIQNCTNNDTKTTNRYKITTNSGKIATKRQK